MTSAQIDKIEAHEAHRYNVVLSDIMPQASEKTIKQSRFFCWFFC